MRFLQIIIIIFLAIAIKTSAQETVQVAGKLTDNNGRPLTGIKISFGEKGFNHTYTDRNGDYKLDIKEGEYKIFFSIYRLKNTQEFNRTVEKDQLLNFSIPVDSFFAPVIQAEASDESKSMHPHAFRILTSDGESVGEGSAKIREVTIGSSDRLTTSESEKGIVVDNLRPLTVESSSMSVSDAQAGTLTSGEVNDFRKWNLWQDLNNDEFTGFIDKWEFTPTHRYTVQLVNMDNKPVIDAHVSLKNSLGETLWIGRTDNTGKTELWPKIFSNTQDENQSYNIEILYNEEVIEYSGITDFYEGVNVINIPVYCENKQAIDILFAVDATGSMGDEISYLQAELNDIIKRVKENNQGMGINLGSVFYRDNNDEYLVTASPFSPDIDKTIDFINKQSAAGGGDMPEAVDAALMTAVNEFNWSENAVSKLMFLILDAPPHSDPEAIGRLKELTARAALEGIRIIPVACSGVDKPTEFILRSIALATNGTYVFLTDDSGVGGAHIEPSTDNYDVEKLNDLFIRLIEQFTMTPKCNSSELADSEEYSGKIFNEGDALRGGSVDDIAKIISCYPNPSDGNFTLELYSNLDELFVVDLAGKIIQKVPFMEAGKYAMSIANFPSGIYYIKFLSDGKWGASKILVQR